MNNPDTKAVDTKRLLLFANKFSVEWVDLVRAIETGGINDTYIVSSGNSGQKYILQKLHGIFTFDLLSDIEVITSHLVSNGFTTPTLIPTLDGNPGLVDGGDIWRMITFVPGRTLVSVTPSVAESVGLQLAAFHRQFVGFNYDFKHRIEGFHNIEISISRLKAVQSVSTHNAKSKILKNLSSYIFEEYQEISFDFTSLPQRIVHGDPKLSNFIFDETGSRAVCLVDLDTLSNDNIVVELGDAIRSICYVEGAEGIRFEKEVFTSFIRGYLSVADFLTKQEISDIIKGVKYVTLDLCARYLTDAYEESYFKLDSSKYDSLFEQNSTKASRLVSFYKEVKRDQKQLAEIVANC